ncbi:MAG: cation:proton antiporter [Acidimicrobiia bacterium]|nr:cation:proton antiporter [Acidimicrobiia bacterium]
MIAALVAAGTAGTVLIELGAFLLLLAVLGRLADRIGVPSIPLYLLAGLAVGEGGIHPLEASQDFIAVGSDIGVVLLLVMLGLEYSSAELFGGLRTNGLAGVVDLVANLTPGLVAGLLLGWSPLTAVLLGGARTCPRRASSPACSRRSVASGTGRHPWCCRSSSWRTLPWPSTCRSSPAS